MVELATDRLDIATIHRHMISLSRRMIGVKFLNDSTLGSFRCILRVYVILIDDKQYYEFTLSDTTDSGHT